MSTLKEWLPHEALSSFPELVEKFGDLKVVEEFNWTKPFPQASFNYRNVMNWVLLEDGSAVGWNESPRSGWAFPRVGRKTVSKILEN